MSSLMWFYARRLDESMSKQALLKSDRYYADCLHCAGGMAGAW